MNARETMDTYEQDALLAEKVCEWTPLDTEHRFWGGGSSVYYTGDLNIHPSISHCVNFHPTTDRNAFAEVEAALARRGLWKEYLHAITVLIEHDSRNHQDNLDMWIIAGIYDEALWKLFTAPLAIRCKAALRAGGVEVEK